MSSNGPPNKNMATLPLPPNHPGDPMPQPEASLLDLWRDHLLQHKLLQDKALQQELHHLSRQYQSYAGLTNIDLRTKGPGNPSINWASETMAASKPFTRNMRRKHHLCGIYHVTPVCVVCGGPWVSPLTDLTGGTKMVRCDAWGCTPFLWVRDDRPIEFHGFMCDACFIARTEAWAEDQGWRDTHARLMEETKCVAFIHHVFRRNTSFVNELVGNTAPPVARYRRRGSRMRSEGMRLDGEVGSNTPWGEMEVQGDDTHEAPAHEDHIYQDDSDEEGLVEEDIVWKNRDGLPRFGEAPSTLPQTQAGHSGAPDRAGTDGDKHITPWTALRWSRVDERLIRDTQSSTETEAPGRRANAGAHKRKPRYLMEPVVFPQDA